MTTAQAQTPPPPVEGPQFNYEFAMVPLKWIVTDTSQRPLTTFVDSIVKDFKPGLVGTLALSQRSKTKFAAIDGQTRAEGMRQLGFEKAPALVYRGLSVEEEADMFVELQTQRRGMGSADKFKAELIAQRPEAMAISVIVTRCGFEINAAIAKTPNTIAAVAALKFVYWGARRGKNLTANPELLAGTLNLIKSAWPKLPESARGQQLIKGVGTYLSIHPDIDQDFLVGRLQRHTPSDLGKRAHALREGRGMSAQSPAFMAEAIENLHNKLK